MTGQGCDHPARFDVVYRLGMGADPDPIGIRVCLAHLAEMREGERRGMLVGLNVQDLQGAH